MDDITVIGPDGARHTFPAGTSGDVINSTLGRHYQSGPAEQAAVASAVRGGGRSQGRRFETNTVDGYSRSLLGRTGRGMDPAADGFDSGDFNTLISGVGKLKEGEPLDWLLDRTFGNDRGFYRTIEFGSPGSAANRQERQRREDYDAAAAADPISNPLDFASFLAGQLVGGGVSPENWIGGGGGRVAGSGARVVFTNFARQAAEQAAIAGATDIYLQNADVADDIQDEFSLMQLGTSALVGGAIGGGTSFIPSGAPKAAPGRTADDLLKEALDAAEDTFSVPTHEGAIPLLPEPARLGSLPAGATDVVRIEGGGALPGDVWDPALNAWVHRVDGPTTAEAPSAAQGRSGIDPYPDPFPDSHPDLKIDVIHASPNGFIQEFDPGRMGDSTNAPSAREGFFFATRPEAETGMAYIDSYRSGTRETPRNPTKAIQDFKTTFANNVANVRGISGERANLDPADLDAAADAITVLMRPLAEAKVAGEVTISMVDSFYEQAGDLIRDLATKLDPTGNMQLRSMTFGYLDDLVNASVPDEHGSARIIPGTARDTVPPKSMGSTDDIGRYRLNIKNPLIHDDQGRGYREESYYDVIRRAKDAGHDGVIIKNTTDGGRQDDIVVAFDKDQIVPIGRGDGRVPSENTNPRAAPVIALEIAPNPDDIAATARWNSLTPEVRERLSHEEFDEISREVFETFGVEAEVVKTVGGFENEVNPSFAVRINKPERSLDVANALGYIANQKSAMIVGDYADLPGMEAGSSVYLQLPGLASDSFGTIYTALRAQLGDDAIGGFTGVEGGMQFLNFSGKSDSAFEADIDAALSGITDLDFDYDLSHSDTNFSFPSQETYGYGRTQNQPRNAGAEGADASRQSLQERIDDIRNRSTERLERKVRENGGTDPAPGQVAPGSLTAPAAPAAPEAPQAASGGNGGSTPPPRDGAGAAPPPEPPKGNGAGGWSDVDWATRGSPERAEAAIKHLDFLQKVIKPEQVAAFLRVLDAGLPTASEGTYVNMDWIDWAAFKGKPEETLGLQNLIADVFDDVFKAAGMKKQSHAETKRLANDMGVSLSDVAKTHADITGDGGITARLHVLRNVANASAADARVQMGVLRNNLRKGANADDIRAAAEIIERTVILSAMDKTAAGEVARALNARKAMSKPAYIVNDLQEALDSLNGALNDPNGIDNPLDVGKVLDDLIRSYDTKGAGGLNRRVRKIKKMGVLGYLNYLAVGNMLSAPISAFRNLVGTPMMGMGDLAGRYITAGVVAPTRKALLALGGRTDRHVTVQDTFALLEGAWDGMGPSLHLGLQAAIKGAPIYDNLSSSLLNNPQQVPYALSKARMAKWQKDGFTLDTIADVAGVGLFEVVRTVGFRPSAAADEFYKSLSRHGAIRSYAIREANYQASRQSTPAEAKRTYDETLKGIMDDPTAEAVQAARDSFEAGDVDLDTNYGPGSEGAQHQAILMGIDLRKAAEDHALLMSFQNTGPMVRSIDQLLRKIPLFRTLAANFVNTPAQILVAAFRDYNPILAGPILVLEHLTPTGQARHAAFFRALRGEEDSLTAGPAAELAIGKMAVGALVMSTMGAIWAAGNLVGNEVPEGDEYEGVRPNSIKLPGLGWTEFTGFAPAAMTMGLIADMGHLFRTADLTHDQQFSLAGAVGVVVRLQLQNLPVLQGLETVMTALSGKKVSGDDDGAAGRAMEQAKNDLLLIRATPAGNLLKKITEDVDPVMRDARGFFQQLQANLPGLSSGLVASRDFMGRVRTREDAASGALQLLKTSAPTGDALAQELHSFKSRVDEPWEPSPPSRFLDGIELTPDELGRMTEVQGQLYRDRRTGRNMEEALRYLITTPAYLEAGRNHQPEMFSDVVSDYRRAGKAAVHNPRSPHYMRDMAVRIGPLRAARDASQRGLDAPAAMRRRGQTYGLLPQDQEALASALAEIN